MNIIKKIVYVLALPFMILFNSISVFAHCPLCSAAVGTGVLFTRAYGLPDSIVGLWLGAFVVSTALWLNRLLKKEYFKLQSFFIVIIGLLLTIIPLYYAGIITYFYHNILGINELLLGILLGTLLTYIGIFISIKIKEAKGKVLFPYQTIVIILLILVVASLLMNFFRWSIG